MGEPKMPLNEGIYRQNETGFQRNVYLFPVPPIRKNKSSPFTPHLIFFYIKDKMCYYNFQGSFYCRRTPKL